MIPPRSYVCRLAGLLFFYLTSILLFLNYAVKSEYNKNIPRRSVADPELTNDVDLCRSGSTALSNGRSGFLLM